MTKPAQVAPYPLRMPDELRQRLEASADKIGRSLNAEIVERLDRSFYEAPLSGLSVQDVIKVTDHVIKTLYTDYVRKDELNTGQIGKPSRARRTLANAPTIDDIPTLANAPTLADIPTLNDLPSLSDDTKPRRITRVRKPPTKG